MKAAVRADKLMAAITRECGSVHQFQRDFDRMAGAIEAAYQAAHVQNDTGDDPDVNWCAIEALLGDARRAQEHVSAALTDVFYLANTTDEADDAE